MVLGKSDLLRLLTQLVQTRYLTPEEIATAVAQTEPPNEAGELVD
jgi:hypothetical protein